eukprot:3280928-Prymnesium_polylepis.2
MDRTAPVIRTTYMASGDKPIIVSCAPTHRGDTELTGWSPHALQLHPFGYAASRSPNGVESMQLAPRWAFQPSFASALNCSVGGCLCDLGLAPPLPARVLDAGC